MTNTQAVTKLLVPSNMQDAAEASTRYAKAKNAFRTQ